MRLYHSTTSPFVRKVMVTLLETGQAGDVALVPVMGNPVDVGTLPIALNPLGKIPALERPDGPTLYDSRVICRFLDDRAQANLYLPARLWDVLTMEATADGILDAAVLMVYETRTRPEDKRHMLWVDAQWAKIARALDALDERWLSHLHGPLHMGQIAVGAALGYLDFRHAARGWRDGRAGLAEWYAGFAQRPAMVATQPHE
jgi:glutathione S-transferase